ncbi:hypothetical protein DFH29DRAFT_874170 [Suillus ampliporus]|nr:hypothetical protein DFH29DRAFT_874170 [Suillus ampliporus]
MYVSLPSSVTFDSTTPHTVSGYITSTFPITLPPHRPQRMGFRIWIPTRTLEPHDHRSQPGLLLVLPRPSKPAYTPYQPWWHVRAGHIVDVPLAQGKERNAAAGAPTNDDDLIRDEDYIPSTPPSPNPDSQQRPAGGQIDIGDHGTGRLCGCF